MLSALGMEGSNRSLVNNNNNYDLIVIGSGPAGQKGAICAAKLRKRVAVIDRRLMIGGVCVHTGTIPSKSIREAIFQLTGTAVKTFYGSSYRGNGDISLQDLSFRVTSVVSRETEVIRAQLKRNGIAIYQGTAEFLDPHTVQVQGEDDKITLHGENILIACGTRPARSPDIPFDGKRILDTDEFTFASSLPREVIVVGAGVVGLEYASFMAAIGAEVTLIDQRPLILDFVDREIVEALAYHLRQMGTTFRLGEKVTRVGIDAQRNLVFAELESGKKVQGDMLLYAVGRQANGDQLRLEAGGLQTDSRGKIKVNEDYQTDVPHIYAAGDVIGFPALASTSMEQGRLASCRMFGTPSQHMPELFPYGIYTIPEISMVGQTEEKLTAGKVPYEVGISKYAELAKSMMLGDETGMLKLLFDRNTRKLLGVHIIGQRATEIVHIGQAVLAHGGSIEYFRDTVFNYPTLAEAYKVAALDGLNKL
ncbi:MAG TPA: Si-specific NAD(P)(+) transhydrogenase [Terriglobales bacterium]|nr:Si-specific NAD(P)(+) transhydrogenase [Terriglobales bacterium]